ncbi:MAG: S-layer protein [Methanofastidiosum sp.]
MKTKISLILTLMLILQLFFINPIISADVPRSFFVDTTNGQPQSIIVVGKNAASMDSISGSLIITKIQAEAYYEDPSKGLFRVNIWDREKLITYDELLMEDVAKNNNLILVGGPVANRLVANLVREGKSKVDWYTSQGDIEYIPNGLYPGRDVVIVAGADREKTREAVRKLISS